MVSFTFKKCMLMLALLSGWGVIRGSTKAPPALTQPPLVQCRIFFQTVGDISTIGQPLVHGLLNMSRGEPKLNPRRLAYGS